MNLGNMKNGRWIQNYDNPADEIIINALDENAMSLRYVKNPSDAVIEYAINKNSFSIQYVKNPSIEQQMKALSRNVAAIQVIDKPCNEIINYANQIDPNKMRRYEINEIGNYVKVKNIKNKKNNSLVKTEEIAKKYVIIEKIRSIENPPYEMQIEAIQSDYGALHYIKEIHPKIYKELYFDKNFDVYSLEDFNLQLKIISAFDILEKKYGKRTEESTTSTISGSHGEIGDSEVLRNVDRKTKEYRIHVKEFLERLVIKLVGSDMVSELITSEIPISEYINEFSLSEHLTDMYVACGYVYRSGLDMIEPAIKELKDKNGKLELIIGSLKDYYKASTDNKIINMDVNTVQYLNYLIGEKLANVSTYENQFYHGKYYFMQGKEISCCIIGSSNLSLSGFAANYELNTLYLFKNDCVIYQKLKEWFSEFKKQCIPIERLLECNFADTNMVFDTISNSTTAISVDIDKIENEIRMLTDQEVKFRLNLWLSKKPTNIYRKLNIDKLNDYIAFEFADYNLIVFESFVSGNGYYYFDSNNIFETIEKIKQLSKTEIFQMTDMRKRGYHVKEANTLVKNINSLFNNRKEIYEYNTSQRIKHNTITMENPHSEDSKQAKSMGNSITGLESNQTEEDIIYIIDEDSIRCPIHNTKMEIKTLSLGIRMKDTVYFCKQCKKKIVSQNHYLQIRDNRSFKDICFKELK